MQVPRTELPEVALDNIPNAKARFTPVESNSMLENMGRSVMNISGQLGKIGALMQEELNQSISTDATNQAFALRDKLTNDKDEGYRNLLGRNALERPEGADLLSEYLGKFDDGIQGIESTLKNEAQKQMFRQNVATLRNQMMSDTRKHLMQQNHAYQDSVADGRIQTGLRMLAESDEPEAWQAGINYALGGAADKYRRAGLSEEEAHALIQKDIGQGIQAAIAQRLDRGDIASAQQYYDRFGIYMGANALRASRNAIQEIAFSQENSDIGKQLARIGIEGGGDLHLTQHHLSQDSGGNLIGAFANYLISPKSPEYTGKGRKKNPRSSATGWGQFIDSTLLHYVKKALPELAKGKSDAQLLKLRDNKEVMAELTAAYARDNASILDKNGLPVTMGTLYLSHFLDAPVAARVLKAPPETPIADIVGAKVMNANPHLKNKTAQWTVDWAHQKMGDKNAVAVSQKTVALKDAQAVQDYIDQLPLPQQKQVKQSYNQALAQHKAQQDAQTAKNMTDALTVLERTGGDYSQLPPTLLGQLDPKARAQLQSYANSKVSGDETALFNQHRHDYYTLTNNPDLLMKMPREQVAALRARFGLSRTQQLLNLYDQSAKEYASGKKEGAAAKVNANVVANLAQLYDLRKLGKGDEEETQQYYNFADNVQRLADAFFQTQKRNPTEAELFDLARKEVSKKVIIEKGWFFDDWQYAMTLNPEEKQRYTETKE